MVLLVINLGVSLPNAPANVGAYQFFCVLGLSVFQVEKTTATGFSIFAFLALTFPFVFLGFAALDEKRPFDAFHAREGRWHARGHPEIGGAR